MLNDPDYLREIDRLKFSLGLCFAISLFLFFVPKDGTTAGSFAADMSTVFGTLTLVLLGALLIRTLLRWKQRNSN